MEVYHVDQICDSVGKRNGGLFHFYWDHDAFHLCRYIIIHPGDHFLRNITCIHFPPFYFVREKQSKKPRSRPNVNQCVRISEPGLSPDNIGIKVFKSSGVIELRKLFRVEFPGVNHNSLLCSYSGRAPSQIDAGHESLPATMIKQVYMRKALDVKWLSSNVLCSLSYIFSQLAILFNHPKCS